MYVWCVIHESERNMDILEIIKNRRSVRKYTGEAIPEEKLDKILKAGLLSPSGRNIKPWEFILVRDKETLNQLSKSRPAGSGIIAGADAAIVVVGDTGATDVWTEDCSIAMAYMHLAADSEGVGSCWVQGRCRMAPDGGTTESFIRELLDIPDNYALAAILCLGMPDGHPEAHTEDEMLIGKVHREKF